LKNGVSFEFFLEILRVLSLVVGTAS